VAVIRRKIIFKDRPKPLISEENRGLSAGEFFVFCVLFFSFLAHKCVATVAQK
jgi:hypothetical protein